MKNGHSVTFRLDHDGPVKKVKGVLRFRISILEEPDAEGPH